MTLVATLAGALAWALLRDVARSAIAVNVAIAIAGLGSMIAARFWYEVRRSPRAESFGIFAVLLTLLGAINALNLTLTLGGTTGSALIVDLAGTNNAFSNSLTFGTIHITGDTILDFGNSAGTVLSSTNPR